MNRGRSKFAKYRKIISAIARIFAVFPKSIQGYLLQKNRNTRGYFGQAIRYALLKNLTNSIGENVSIKEGVYLYNCDKLTIGDNVSIWPMSYIDAFGGVIIGNDVSIAHGTSIISFEHTFHDNSMPIKEQEVVPLKICIEDNVWIGAKTTILGGTTIHSGSVIGAGSVVKKDVESNSVYVGIPARKMKSR